MLSILDHVKRRGQTSYLLSLQKSPTRDRGQMQVYLLSDVELGQQVDVEWHRWLPGVQTAPHRAPDMPDGQTQRACVPFAMQLPPFKHCNLSQRTVEHSLTPLPDMASAVLSVLPLSWKKPTSINGKHARTSIHPIEVKVSAPG